MAEEEEVMKIWQGLGYYSRARNMHHSAKEVNRNNNNRFPASYDELRKLKGIGDYSASAISSISNNEPHPVVDGNVLRVMARYKGIKAPVNSATTKKKIRAMLEDLIDRKEPGTFNQAVMELGALVCKPKQPLCRECPVSTECHAFKTGTTDDFPVVEKAKPLKTRYFHYLVIISGKGAKRSTWINKRTGNDIWKNLYDFPVIETENEISPGELERTEAWKSLFKGYDFKMGTEVESFRHLLSHQELKVRFYQVFISGFRHDLYMEIPVSEIHKYPVPRLVENYLKKVQF
jgi:A/G-specific adenine glycosylase